MSCRLLVDRPAFKMAHSDRMKAVLTRIATHWEGQPSLCARANQAHPLFVQKAKIQANFQFSDAMDALSRKLPQTCFILALIYIDRVTAAHPDFIVNEATMLK